MAKATGRIEIEVEDEVLLELVRNMPAGRGGGKDGEVPKELEVTLEFSEFGGQVRFTTEEE